MNSGKDLFLKYFDEIYVKNFQHFSNIIKKGKDEEKQKKKENRHKEKQDKVMIMEETK